MLTGFWLIVGGLFAASSVCAYGEGPAAPQVVRIQDNERVLHIVGLPFTHPGCKPYLETLLVARYGHHGLAYRRISLGNLSAAVNAGYCRTTAEVAKNLKDNVLIHKPTLVIIQPGNFELGVQSRRHPNYDYDSYPKVLEQLVQALRAQGIRIILCSTIPVGTSESLQKLSFPNDHLAGWVSSAREIARKHDAVFVDLFSQAVTWPMTSPSQDYYSLETYEKSWVLFQSQVRFEPGGSRVTIQADTATVVEANGAAVESLQKDGAALSFTLKNSCGVGPLMLSIKALPAGDYSVRFGGKEALRKKADDLTQGVDIGSALVSAIGSKEYLAEMDAGYKASEKIVEIQRFQLPAWAKVADFEAQKTAGLRKTEDQLSTHDAKLREMTAPAPLAIVVQPAKN